ncbi:DUF1194 domain-containing protein [Chenggangzhangella methanolivorans]|uniref:DUF1194 domain-containing protein n=1 Tax=Chenggangzhangella methanolivorans TaxID=1437009 RepID=A0A9E6UPU8_9HYPH|nr:DUF1194 domain-containing protein [Chenggangzhangella methanolivorans]QZO01834.1 DUF1194 domain-containing protein [Chenggangzhangella methanolivorans]
MADRPRVVEPGTRGSAALKGRAVIEGFANRLVAVALICAAAIGGAPAREAEDARPATALVLSIDVSGSVDEARYNLQLEGIAEALEDPVTLSAISATGGAGVWLSVVTWADGARVSVGWRRVASLSDARAFADEVRRIPREPGQFTCIGGMLRVVSQTLIPALPNPVETLVVDVSGDGIDNCGDVREIHEERDAVLALGATINGLPILVPGENDVVGVGAFRKPGFGLRELPSRPDQEATTLDRWYRDHVIGGPGAFLLVAQGYEDFSRALRRKLVTEISLLARRSREPSGPAVGAASGVVASGTD